MYLIILFDPHTDIILGAPWSHVIAQIDEYGAITAVMHFDDDQIHVEPAWRHIAGALSNQSVVYRATDVDLKFGGAYDKYNFTPIGVLSEIF